MIIDTNILNAYPSARILMDIYLLNAMIDYFKKRMGISGFLENDQTTKSTKNIILFIAIVLFAIGLYYSLGSTDISTVFTHILLLKILVEMENCKHKTDINIYNK